MIPVLIFLLPAAITGYSCAGFPVLFSCMSAIPVPDKKVLLQLSPSQQGNALVLHTGH
jgi:hypothetical protein